MDAAVALTPLAEIPSPTQSVWHVAGLPIRAYALCIVLGIVAACVVTEIRMRRRGAPPNLVLDIAVWAVPFGILGARLYHIITWPGPYFGSNGHVIDVLKVWEGGLGIWGAVAGGAVGAWIACRRHRIPLTFFADALAPGLPLAQGIGRWGNYFNNELAGRETDLPWGLKTYQWDWDAGRAITEDGEPLVDGVYHPTFLYESLWDIGVALLVWALDRRYRFGRGRAFALYVAAYCVGRFWIEAMRADDSVHLLGMRLNNWTALIVLAGAIVYFVLAKGPRQLLAVDEDGTIRAYHEGSQAPEVAATSEAAGDDTDDRDEINDRADEAAPPDDDLRGPVGQTREPAADTATDDGADPGGGGAPMPTSNR